MYLTLYLTLPAVPAAPATPPAEHPTPPLDHHEKARLRAAAAAARRTYPGPVGELVAHELSYRGLIARVVDDVMRPAPSVPSG